MLVLTRKQQQQIQIGENITITIVRVKGQSVRVGIQAPEGVRILRSELEEAVALRESCASGSLDGETSRQPATSRSRSASKQASEEVEAETSGREQSQAWQASERSGSAARRPALYSLPIHEIVSLHA